MKSNTGTGWICDCPEGYIYQKGDICEKCGYTTSKKLRKKRYYFEGKYRAVYEIEKMMNFGPNVISNRLRAGWTFDRAVYTKSRKKHDTPTKLSHRVLK